MQAQIFGNDGNPYTWANISGYRIAASYAPGPGSVLGSNFWVQFIAERSGNPPAQLENGGGVPNDLGNNVTLTLTDNPAGPELDYVFREITFAAYEERAVGLTEKHWVQLLTFQYSGAPLMAGNNTLANGDTKVDLGPVGGAAELVPNGAQGNVTYGAAVTDDVARAIANLNGEPLDDAPHYQKVLRSFDLLQETANRGVLQLTARRDGANNSLRALLRQSMAGLAGWNLTINDALLPLHASSLIMFEELFGRFHALPAVRPRRAQQYAAGGQAGQPGAAAAAQPSAGWFATSLAELAGDDMHAFNPGIESIERVTAVFPAGGLANLARAVA